MKKRITVTLTLVLALLISAFALVIGVSASESEPSLEVKCGALALEDSVEMLFLVGYDGVAPEDVELLIWTGSGVNVADCEKGNEEYALTSKEYNTANKEIVFRFKGLAAAEMTKNVYAKAYADGTESAPFKYSIVEYAYNMINKDTTEPALKQVLLDMLVYGASAQNYFNRDDAPLASSDFGKVILNGAVFADGMNHELIPAGTVITLSAPTTEELPYAIWTGENGNIISVSAEFEYTVLAGDNNLTATLSASQSSFGLYEHVVIIGVDGAGAFPTSVEYNTSTPNIDSIFADGAVTKTMRVASPTSSAASWGAMLHGSLPYQNGIFDNAPVEAADAAYPIDSKFPSFLKHIVDTDDSSKVAVFSGWSGITNGILEEDVASGIYQQRKSDADNLADVKNYINANRDFKAIFYQINNPDAMGHNYDYISEQYYKAIETADQQIGEVYAALEAAGILDKTLFIVTADHGGTTNTGSGTPGTHGGLSDVEKYTMFAVAGYTVEENGTPEDVHIRDIASVALYALGVTQPESYSSRVPSGVFAGVEAGERPVYNDPDNPRDAVSQPTPEYNSAANTVAGIDNELWYYLPFDSNLDELVNEDTTTEAKGTISYEKGYFGDAVVLDDGHVVMDNFATGTESFTVSMWVKSAGPNGVPPIVASRNRATGTNRGFLVAMRRTALSTGTTFTLEWSFSNGVGAPDSYSNPYYMPDDFSRGWMHIVVVFDKEAGEVRLATDFGKLTTWSHSYLTADADLTNELRQLVFGDDLSQNYSSKMGLSIDEFMIFHGALDREEINDLAEYYGKKGVPTIKDALGFAPSLDLNFNGNVSNEGSDTAIFDDVKMNYVDSPFGLAGNFTGSFDSSGKPAYWANSSDYNFSKEQEGGGYNDLTFSFWLSLQSADVSTRIIFSTTNYDQFVSGYSGDRMSGMALTLSSKPTKATLAEISAISYMNPADYVDDGEGYAKYASGEFAGEYVYKQSLRISWRAPKPDGSIVGQENDVNFYAPLKGWTNIVMVVERGEYAVNDGIVTFYQDGHRLEDAKNGFSIHDTVEDGSLFGVDSNGKPYGFMINDDVFHFTHKRNMDCYLDEFTIFDRALTEEQLAALAKYYEAIRD